jgi:Tudor domain-containing protein
LTIVTVQPGKIDYFFSFIVLIYISLDDGYYIITQIRSPAEFYGLSQNRQHDFEILSKELEQYYNNSDNDQSLTVLAIPNGTPCVIEQYDKYYRVIIK